MRNLLLLFCLLACSSVQAKPKIQASFDPLGPTIKTIPSAVSQRDIVYVDEGESDWQPVVFVGGGGTSGRVFALLEFLRTTRENLQLRFIGVERNGFGVTGFDESLDYQDYADDVSEVLDHLGIEDFSLFAISGVAPMPRRSPRATRPGCCRYTSPPR